MLPVYAACEAHALGRGPDPSPQVERLTRALRAGRLPPASRVDEMVTRPKSGGKHITQHESSIRAPHVLVPSMVRRQRPVPRTRE